MNIHVNTSGDISYMFITESDDTQRSPCLHAINFIGNFHSMATSKNKVMFHANFHLTSS